MAISLIRGVELTSLTEANKRAASHLASKMWYKPSWDELIYSRTRKWWMTFLLGKIGGVEYRLENSFFWNEEGKYYGKKTIHATVATTIPSAGQFKITLNEADAYFVVTDIVDLGVEKPGEAGQNAQGQVIEVGTDTGNQYIVVKILDSTIIGSLDASDFPANNEISLSSNAQGECFEIPKGRMHLPDRRDNYIQKISTTYAVCDEATRKRLYFKTTSGAMNFLDYEDQLTQETHHRNVDNAVLFGQKSLTTNDDGYEQYTTEGIISSLVKGSMLFEKSAAYTDENIQDILSTMAKYSKGDTFDYFSGQTHCVQIQRAMKEYAINGSFSFGNFDNGKMEKFGMNVTRYRFGNMTMNLWNYKGFDDPDFLPQNANSTDYSDFGMLLYLKDGAIKIQYQRQRSGKVLKDWFDEYSGPTQAENHKPTSRNACKERAWTTAVGTKVKGLNNHALVLKA